MWSCAARVTSGSRSLRFITDSPSDDPIGTQTVELRVRCRWVDVFGAANPDAGDPNVTLSLLEGTTVRATGSAQAITTSFAEYSLFLTEAQVNAFTSWSDLRAQMVFEASGIDIDEEVDIEVSRVRVVFDE